MRLRTGEILTRKIKKTNEEALKYPDDLYVMGAYDTSKGKNLDYHK